MHDHSHAAIPHRPDTASCGARDRQMRARAIIGFIGAGVCAAACLLGATAYAADLGDGPRRAAVRYLDLDLSHPAGRATLTTRLQSAARLVCRDGDSRPSDRVAEARCIRVAMSGAVPGQRPG